MTISSETRKAGPFNGNDVTTSFPFTFKAFEKANVRVIYTDALLVETTLVLDSDYTIALNGDQNSNPGGTVSYSTLATGEKLTILGAVEYTQETDIQNQGGFYPEVIENALDKVTMQIQQVKEIADRSVQVPVSSDTLPEDYLTTVEAYKVEAEAAASNAAASETAAGLSEAAAGLSEAAALLAKTNAELAEANAEAAQAAAAISASEAEATLALITTVATTTSSVTSNSISIAQKTFTVEAGKSFFVGMSLRAAFNATNYMNGEVVSYSGTTLVLNVLSVKGSGTYAAWAIFQSQDSVISTPQYEDASITNAKLAQQYINDLTTVTIALTDSLSIADASDSGNKKKALVSDIFKIAPAFSAYATGNQAVTSGVATKVTLGAENYDTNGNFAASRFTPTVEGYYLVNATVRGSATSITTISLDFYKNGAQIKRIGLINIPAATTSLTISGSEIFYMNGTTDYLELYATVNGTSPVFETLSATNTSTFSGILVRLA